METQIATYKGILYCRNYFYLGGGDAILGEHKTDYVNEHLAVVHPWKKVIELEQDPTKEEQYE